MKRESTIPFDNYEKLFRSFLQLSGECVLFLDKDLIIIETNPKTYSIYNIPNEKLVGKDFSNLIAPNDRNTLYQIFMGIGVDATWGGQLNGLLSSGKTFPIEIILKRMGVKDRTLFCIFIRDLSEYKKVERELKQEKNHRRELYITLRNVMGSIEKEKKGMERLIAHKIETLLLPTMEKASKESSKNVRNSYLHMIREELLGLTSIFPKELDIPFMRLTRSEMVICNYIQSGYSSKEVADTLNISFETIQTHRKNIRKKLGLHGRKVSLYSFLSTRRKLGGALKT